MSAGGPPDRSTKRHKGDGPMGGPPPPEGYHGAYGQPHPPGPGRYQQSPYGPGGPPMGPQSGYMWQHGQYGNPPPPHPPPPPHSWNHGSPPPPGGMYPQRGGPSMTPDRGGYGSAYPRGPPPPPMQGPGGRRAGKPPPPPPPPPGSASRPGSKTPDGPGGSGGGGGGNGGPPDGPPQPSYQGGWPPHSQGGQWPQHQWGGGPPPVWQGGGPPPPIHQPPGYGNPGMYHGGAGSPPRPSQGRPRGSPEMMGGYPGGGPGSGSGGGGGGSGGGGGGGGSGSGSASAGPLSAPFCQPVESPDLDMYQGGRGRPPHDDDGNESTAGGNSAKDKGRGSYKCGRCGVPKKGHVCPYQPKLTRRPGEPLPEMRSAAIQVEMDEFMTLRRLNLKIQGFPESYASEPYMEEDMVVGEPHPHAITSSSPPVGGPGPRHNGSGGGEMLTEPGGSSTSGLPGQEPMGMLGSPIRSSPIADDPITGAA